MKVFACVVMLVCIIGMVTGALTVRDSRSLPEMALGHTLASTGFIGFLLACVVMVLADIRTTLGWKPAGTAVLVPNEKAID